MGIIKKTLSAKPERAAVTIIARGNFFTGDVRAMGRMHIDGAVDGTITSSSGVSIGREGRVKGKIKAPRVNVSGVLEGEVHCNELHIESGGELRGLAICRKMSIDSEGTFVGERRTIETVVSPEPQPQKPVAALMSDMIDALPDRIVLSGDDGQQAES
ncbi:MAG: polymer-forming cytoskeletal protein [Marinobacterium sp.]|nr:polymer-forming cytoskeletal protein [Marinobacterium sp.]